MAEAEQNKSSIDADSVDNVENTETACTAVTAKTPWAPYTGGIPLSLTYFEGTMYEMVRSAAARYPENIAFDFMGRGTTYREMMREIEKCARALRAAGVGENDRVTIALPNCPQAIYMLYAVNLAGAVANMIHPLSAEKEIEFYLNASRSRVAVTLDQFYGKFAAIKQGTDLRTLIIASIRDELALPVRLGYDLTAIHSRNGDYAPGELAEAMDGTADAIAEAYRKHAKGATLIFAVSVHQCQEIAARIPGAVVVTGETQNRAEIIERFTRREIPCLVNCMVFTEGTDMPLVETVIIARPTQSDSLYTQMVGRGLRPHPDKEKLHLIDCVGSAKPGRLQTAPSLLGVDLSNVPERKLDELEGELFDLPVKAVSLSDCPESWIKNVQIVDLWAKEQNYQTHGVNWFKLPDGSMTVSLMDRHRLTIPCPDALGNVKLYSGEVVPMQEALDRAYKRLNESYADQQYVWDANKVKQWGRKPASEAQLRVIRRRLPKFDAENLTKGEASQIMNRLCYGYKGHGR